jgi:hypothetical protein
MKMFYIHQIMNHKSTISASLYISNQPLVCPQYTIQIPSINVLVYRQN